MLNQVQAQSGHLLPAGAFVCIPGTVRWSGRMRALTRIGSDRVLRLRDGTDERRCGEDREVLVYCV
jgi:hypothetical protein